MRVSDSSNCKCLTWNGVAAPHVEVQSSDAFHSDQAQQNTSEEQDISNLVNGTTNKIGVGVQPTPFVLDQTATPETEGK